MSFFCLGDQLVKRRLGRWLVWFVALLLVPFQFLLQSSSSIMIPMLKVDFQLTAVGIGFLSASFFYTYFLFQIPSGILIDKYGARRIILFGMMMCTAAVVLFATATNVWVAISARFLMGVATAPAISAAMYIGSVWLPIELFALVAALTESFGTLGGAFGQRFLPHFIQLIGWRSVLLHCALAGVFFSVLVWLCVVDKNKRPHGGSKLVSIVGSLKPLFFSKQVWLIGLFCGISFAPLVAFSGLWAVPYLSLAYHEGLVAAARQSSLVFLGAAISGPLFGIASNALRRRKPIILLGLLLQLVMMLVVLYVPNKTLMVNDLCLFVLGLGTGVYVLAFAIIKEITPLALRATAIGWTNMMCLIIGAPIFQPLIGYQLKHTQNLNLSNNLVNYQHAFLVLPIAIAVGLLLVPFIVETRCRTMDGL